MDDWNDSSASRRRLTLGFLTAIYTVGFLDRQILSILQEPIKRDLQLTDSHLALLTGTTFALFYVFAGVPLGRLVDRTKRTRVIAVCLALWSATTALCGAAQQFWQLTLCRMGVGIGEGGCNPAAHSMISDLYPPARRSGALAIYGSGVNLGILIGFMAGGLLVEKLSWRWALILAGLTGLVLALAFQRMIPEPARAASRDTPSARNQNVSVKDIARLFWSDRALLQLMVAMAFIGVATYGITMWSASIMIRSYGASIREAGVWLAISIGIGGIVGTMVTGFLADGQASKGPCACLKVTAATSALLCVGLLLAFTATEKQTAFLWLLLPGTLSAVHVGPSVTAAYNLVPATARGTTSALAVLVTNLAGLGIGPLMLGVLSDHLSPSLGHNSLRQAFLYVAPACALCAALLYYLASRREPSEAAKRTR